jgi:hypothetical protein
MHWNDRVNIPEDEAVVLMLVELCRESHLNEIYTDLSHTHSFYILYQLLNNTDKTKPISFRADTYNLRELLAITNGNVTNLHISHLPYNLQWPKNLLKLSFSCNIKSDHIVPSVRYLELVRDQINSQSIYNQFPNVISITATNFKPLCKFASLYRKQLQELHLSETNNRFDNNVSDILEHCRNLRIVCLPFPSVPDFKKISNNAMNTLLHVHTLKLCGTNYSVVLQYDHIQELKQFVPNVKVIMLVDIQVQEQTLELLKEFASVELKKTHEPYPYR